MYRWLLSILLVFLLDAILPQTVNVWILYLIPLLLFHNRVSKRTMFILIGLSSLLVVGGNIHSTDNFTILETLTNVVIGLGAIWFTTGVLISLRRAEDELRSSESLLKRLSQNAAVGLTRLDRNWVYLSANPAYAKIAGKSVDQIVGHSMAEVLGTKGVDAIRPYVERVLNGEAVSYEQTVPFSGSGSRHLHVCYAPDIDIKGAVYGWVASITDVTEIRAMEKELKLEQAKSMHNSRLASLGEMSAGLAHEINNPLAIISGSLRQLVKLKDDSVKFSAKIESLLKATSRIQKIIEGLKKFSRTSAGDHFQTHSLNSILADVQSLTELKSKSYLTSLSFEGNDLIDIYCDPLEIEQVMIILINNAIDAVKDLSDRWVRVEHLLEGKQVILRVIDSGLGIPASIEEKIFEPFFTTKPVGEGTGLGLSIAKGILEKHKATIGLNRSFSNTCFEIRFPSELPT